ncbi:MarR family winged helix-turn-helix transcriptional regulator [Streptomyces sp. NPDC051636]|uniref:MarR family winged helix-turn-helix transcriptional regulator n=1 Tax=Streptomyces sp. NPDC051636 TaxID=3365663 RepID=UPI0037B9A3D3
MGRCRARLGPIEEAGLITRIHGTGDRRRVRVRLTDAGHAAFEAHAVTEDEGERALLAALTEQERRTLSDLLRKPVVVAEAPARDRSRSATS